MHITIEKMDGDYFHARCQELQGAFAEGDTELEAFYNLMDVLEMIFEYRRTTSCSIVRQHRC
jgi:predicted RNase H-like HicB family nuclease